MLESEFVGSRKLSRVQFNGFRRALPLPEPTFDRLQILFK